MRRIPYLGIEWQIQDGTNDAGRSCQFVAVRRVIVESPAFKAGIREADVISSVDGVLLDPENTLGDVILAKKPGVMVSLELMRKNRRMHVKVTLGTRELPEFEFKPLERPVPNQESVDVRG